MLPRCVLLVVPGAQELETVPSSNRYMASPRHNLLSYPCREAQQAMLDGLQALEGDVANKGLSSLIQAPRQVESAGSGEQACQNSLQAAASSIKSAAGTQPHAAADAAVNPPAGAVHANAEGQAAAGRANDAAAATVALPYSCTSLPVRGHLVSYPLTWVMPASPASVGQGVVLGIEYNIIWSPLWPW